MDSRERRPRLLVVEDEEDIRDLLLMHFKAEFEVHAAGDGLEGLEKCLSLSPDLLILDLMLPRLDGLELCRRLRADGRFRRLPIIMLTARAEEADRLTGFETGADDYVLKPFSLKELTLRVKALLRRSRGGEETGERRPEEAVLNIDGLVIDPAAYQVSYQGRPIVLTALEFRLLHYLAQRPGRVLERGQLLEAVWGYHEESYARTVDTHLRRLRQKLGDAEFFLETVRGVGYRFKAV